MNENTDEVIYDFDKLRNHLFDCMLIVMDDCYNSMILPETWLC